MKKVFIRFIYNLLLAITIIFGIALHQNSFFGEKIIGTDESVISIDLEQASNFFKDASSITKNDKWFVVYNESGELTGFLLHSEQFPPEIKGYNGKVPLLIALNNEKSIIGIEMLPNRETGDFLERLMVKKYLKNWDNYNLLEGIELQVDVVSGATATSVAIARNVKKTLSGFALGINANYQVNNGVNQQSIIRYVVFFLFLTFALFSFFFPTKSSKYRTVLRILSILILGFLLTEMLTIEKFYQWIINGFNLENQLILIILLVLSLGLSLVTGRNFYCNYVCPFGNLQEQIGKTSTIRIKIPRFISLYKSQIRRYLFVGIMIVLSIGLLVDLTKIEPFLAFSYNVASIFVLVLASFFIVLSFFIKRPWCNYFCPTGFVINSLKLRTMKKLDFNEIMNLLLVAVIIILIFKNSANNYNNSETVDSVQRTIAKSEISEKAPGEFVAINDSIYNLPDPVYDSKVSLEYTLKNRRSRRYFTNTPLNSKLVSQILWAAYGITEPHPEVDFVRGGFKTAPSAGALYPLEIYLLSGNISDIPPGLYKYSPIGHRLKRISDQDIRSKLANAAFNQLLIAESQAILVYSAVYERTTSKYGDRGKERYVPMDVGHAAQNVYLQATSLGLGTTAVGAFDDEKVKQLLDMPNNEVPMMVMPFGYCNPEKDKEAADKYLEQYLKNKKK